MFRPRYDYWFALYKLLPTKWYDGNPSAYRNWTGGEPDDPHRCVAYTTNGFDHTECNQQLYYTCKKGAGNLFVSVTYSIYKGCP